MINQLIQIIAQEAILFEEFLDLLEKQKEALVKDDVEALNKISELQCQKLMDSRTLNKKRVALVTELATINEIEGDLTVAKLIELADSSQAERLGSLSLLFLCSGLYDREEPQYMSGDALVFQPHREPRPKISEQTFDS